MSFWIESDGDWNTALKAGGKNKCWGTLNEQKKMNGSANGLGGKGGTKPSRF